MEYSLFVSRFCFGFYVGCLCTITEKWYVA